MKRQDTAPAKIEEPRPCGHPLITLAGIEDYACRFGTDEQPFPRSASGSPMAEVARVAYGEHFHWSTMSHRAIREDLLGPDGKPWTCYMVEGTNRALYVSVEDEE